MTRLFVEQELASPGSANYEYSGDSPDKCIITIYQLKNFDNKSLLALTCPSYTCGCENDNENDFAADYECM